MPARPIFLLAALLGLAACAPGHAPVPQEARLTRDLLTVAMSDGQSCLGPRPEGAGAEGWSGRLSGCSVSYPFEVRLDPRTNPLRQVAEALFGALELDGQMSAIAEVEIATPRGKRLFASPPPRND